jgi:hypothetical protein
MLAHGEAGILPGALIVGFLLPASIWTLFYSIKGQRGVFMMIYALVAVVVGGLGLVGILRDVVLEWPADEGMRYALEVWGSSF